MPNLTKPIALFILGHAGTGKSFLTRHFVLQEQKHGRAWCVLDKDVVSECWSGPFLENLGADPNDRDSPLFKDKVRDLEYASTLRIARDPLELRSEEHTSELQSLIRTSSAGFCW